MCRGEGSQLPNDARDGEALDPESVSTLIKFFMLLDQWDREATRQ